MLIAQHTTFAERVAAAHEGAERLHLTLPVLVDGMDNAASEAFAAWPERIFVAGRDGKLTFAGGPGPYEFDPDSAAAALAETLH